MKSLVKHVQIIHFICILKNGLKLEITYENYYN